MNECTGLDNESEVALWNVKMEGIENDSKEKWALFSMGVRLNVWHTFIGSSDIGVRVLYVRINTQDG